MADLQTTLNTIRTSVSDEWNRIDDGPFFNYSLGDVTAFDGQGGSTTYVEVESHHSAASYIPDISLTIQWGMKWTDDNLSFAWADFADPTIRRTLIDVFWHGALVHRFWGLVVDGGRARIPMPELAEGGVEWLKADEIDIFRVVSSLEAGGWDFDDYVRRTGLEVR